MRPREQLLRAIEEDRRELHLALVDAAGAGERLNLARRIGERPLPWLAGGFVAGALLGLRHAWRAAREVP